MSENIKKEEEIAGPEVAEKTWQEKELDMRRALSDNEGRREALTKGIERIRSSMDSPTASEDSKKIGANQIEEMNGQILRLNEEERKIKDQLRS